jgi:uncharacterized protein YegP (UPF0339 family)
LARMATATRRTAGALDSAATNGGSKLPVGTLTIEVYQENSGRHSWHLTTCDGRNLATSCESFASREDAERSAGSVRKLSAGVEA